MRAAPPLLAVCVALAAAGCGAGTSRTLVPGGDADRGAKLIGSFGCGSCHDIPGIAGADGLEGPSLAHLASVRFIGGVLPNSPANAIRWIVHPRLVDPRTVMPDLGVSDRQARDVVAYLYGH